MAVHWHMHEPLLQMGWVTLVEYMHILLLDVYLLVPTFVQDSWLQKQVCDLSSYILFESLFARHHSMTKETGRVFFLTMTSIELTVLLLFLTVAIPFQFGICSWHKLHEAEHHFYWNFHWTQPGKSFQICPWYSSFFFIQKLSTTRRQKFPEVFIIG